MNTLVKNSALAPFNLLYKVSPELCLRALFRLKQGHPLDLEHPRTFNEKLQWIKLYDHNLLMPQCVDKFTVRGYVESKGLGHTLNELYWEGFDPAEIPFDDLPERFVVKVTHGSTFNIIVKDRASLDRDEVVRKCRRWLKAKFIPCYGEWFYGMERPRVIVERYLEDSDAGQLCDYKVFCFNGKARIVGMYIDRFTDLKSAFFDIDWNILPGCDGGYPSGGGSSLPQLAYRRCAWRPKRSRSRSITLAWTSTRRAAVSFSGRSRSRTVRVSTGSTRRSSDFAWATCCTCRAMRGRRLRSAALGMGAR